MLLSETVEGQCVVDLTMKSGLLLLMIVKQTPAENSETGQGPEATTGPMTVRSKVRIQRHHHNTWLRDLFDFLQFCRGKLESQGLLLLIVVELFIIDVQTPALICVDWLT